MFCEPPWGELPPGQVGLRGLKQRPVLQIRFIYFIFSYTN